MVWPSGGKRLVEDHADGDRQIGELEGRGGLVTKDAADDLKRLPVVIVGGERAQKSITDRGLLGEGDEGAARPGVLEEGVPCLVVGIELGRSGLVDLTEELFEPGA